MLLLPSPVSAEGKDSAQNVLVRKVPIKINLPPPSSGQGSIVLLCAARAMTFEAFQARLVVEVDSGKMTRFINLSTSPTSEEELCASSACTVPFHFSSVPFGRFAT